MHKINQLDKLTTMSDSQIQQWLRRVNSETDINTLTIALSGVDEKVKDCVFRNMSVHAKTLLDESIQKQAHKRLKESEIQKCINALVNLFN